MTDARCRGASVDVFYPAEPSFEEARRICLRCPVREECLAHAVAERERYGVWGGLSPMERTTVAQND